MALQLIHPNTITTRSSLLREYNKHFISIIQDLKEDEESILTSREEKVEHHSIGEVSMIRFDSSLFKTLTLILEQYLNRLYWLEFPKNDQCASYQTVSKWIQEHLQTVLENQYGDFHPLPHLLTHVNNYKCLLEVQGNSCYQTMRDWMTLKIKEFINTNTPNGNVSALHVAVAKGQVDLVYWLLYRLRCNVDGFGSPGNRTPLFIACLKGNSQIARILLECGACKKIDCLFSDDVVMVSEYSGIVRQRIMLNSEQAAERLKFTNLSQMIKEFDLERCIIMKKSNLKFFKHMRQMKEQQGFSDIQSFNCSC